MTGGPQASPALSSLGWITSAEPVAQVSSDCSVFQAVSSVIAAASLMTIIHFRHKSLSHLPQKTSPLTSNSNSRLLTAVHVCVLERRQKLADGRLAAVHMGVLSSHPPTACSHH